MSVAATYLKLPNDLARDVCFVDIETRKVAVPESFRHLLPTGYTMKQRWQCFMIGHGDRDGIKLFHGDDEAALLRFYETQIVDAGQIIYSGTRMFDEMVLKGRFTNARAPLLPKPGPWPHIGQRHPFLCDKKIPRYPGRAADVDSAAVPYEWERGNRDAVKTHCIRDVAALMVQYAVGPDAAERLRKVLTG